ncbi:MAG: acyltransferase domain-containing protein [Bariatricus sp.]
MELQELMNKIRLPEEAQETAVSFLPDEEIYNAKKELFYKDTRAFLKEWKESENHLQWLLSFYLKLALEVYEEYKRQGIAEQIYVDTFCDITIWCEECKRKYGVYGINEAGWIAFSIKMKLFRLGRLQFEPMTLQEDMTGKSEHLKAGTKVLNVHIPTGEKLDITECRKSFLQAEEFFGNSYEAYVCDSWLLAPALKEMLPETSNIIQFQNLFEIVNVHYRFPQAEQRIFADVREDKENYPEDTVLQKRAKEYILSGKDIGIGVGFFKKKSVTGK